VHDVIPGRTDSARRMPVHAKLTERSNDGAKSLKSMGIIFGGKQKKKTTGSTTGPKQSKY
jgi:hypothetical protein